MMPVLTTSSTRSVSRLALGKIAPKTPSAGQVVAALLPVLESKDSFPKVKAIEALSQFGARAAAAIPRIRALEDDRDPEVRNAAARALRVIEN